MKWDETAKLPTSGNLFGAMRDVQTEDRVAQQSGNIGTAFASAAKVLSATYTVEWQMHGVIGPSAAVATVTPSSATVLTNTQGVHRLRARAGLAARDGRAEDPRAVHRGLERLRPLHVGRRGAGSRAHVAAHGRQDDPAPVHALGRPRLGSATGRPSSTTSAERSTPTARSPRSTTRAGCSRSRTRTTRSRRRTSRPASGRSRPGRAARTRASSAARST